MARNGAVRKPPCATEQERHRKQKAQRAARGANACLPCGGIGARPDQNSAGAIIVPTDNRPAHWNSARRKSARTYGLEIGACKQNSAMLFPVPRRFAAAIAEAKATIAVGAEADYAQSDEDDEYSAQANAKADGGSHAHSENCRLGSTRNQLCLPLNLGYVQP